jgi:2-hydroxy-3-oxopropionate reductase
VAVQLADDAAGLGFPLLDAPVSGGEQAAIDGTLSVMAGGTAAAFDTAGPVLAAVGKTIAHVGPSGAGQTVKAANQLIVAGTIELVAEAIVFLEAHGVDPEVAVGVLAGGLAGNAILQRKAPAMLARDFRPGFRIDLHHKDMGIVVEAARRTGVALPLGAAAAGLIASARAQGLGGLDHSALLRTVELLSGRAPGKGEGATLPASGAAVQQPVAIALTRNSY